MDRVPQTFPSLDPELPLEPNWTIPAKINLGEVKINSLSVSGLLDFVDHTLAVGRHRSVAFCEANLLAHAAQNPQVRLALDSSDVTVADGVAIGLLARLRGHRLRGRVPGPSFFLAAMEHGLRPGWRHFFYGGAGGVAERLAVRMGQAYPGVKIVGTHSPPFRDLTESERADVQDRIESAGTQLLWIGLGGPKQELWMAENKGKIQVPVMLAVGAAFDFHAGTRPWAPSWVRALGMEWAFRMLTGGRRTLFRNAKCVTRVSRILLRASLSKPGGRS